MNKQTYIYGSFGLATVICFASLLTWAASGTAGKTLIEKEGEITLSSEVRREYLVNETLDTMGLSFYVDDEEISLNNCKIEYDFTSAGDKVVSVSYEEDKYIYRAYYDVEVFAVRHLDVRDKTISLKRDGNWDFSNLVVWAELSGAPTEFEKPDAFPDINDTVIILNENQYTAEITETNIPEYYNVIIRAGHAAYPFGFTTGNYPQVNSTDRIYQLTNASGTTETLTLFVTYSSSNFAPPTGVGQINVTGTYVFRDIYGTRTDYGFKYTLNGWDSIFDSASYNQGLSDYKGYEADWDAFRVEVKGLTFYAPGTSWHKAVLGG